MYLFYLHLASFHLCIYVFGITCHTVSLFHPLKGNLCNMDVVAGKCEI